MFACIVTVMLPCFVCRMGSSNTKVEEGSQHNGGEVTNNGGMHVLEIHAQSVGVSLIIYIFFLLLLVICIYLTRKFCCRMRSDINTTEAQAQSVAYEMAPMAPMSPIQRLKMAEAPRSPAVRLSQPSAPSLPNGTV